MLRKVILCALVASALGKIQWAATSPIERRLAVKIGNSHTNKTDPDCIVGGYEEENPLKIYIGGPCSELGENAEPSSKFRWVEMETVHNSIGAEGEDEAPFKFIPESGHVFSKDQDDYSQVGTGGSHMLDVKGMKHAAIFALTTSYLSKAAFTYATNDFVTEVNGDGTAKTTVTMCVVPCCAAPGASGCECTDGCPTTKAAATPGMFKYSIMAAAHDLPTWAESTPGAADGSILTPGKDGNGWEKVVETYGTGDSGSKVLTGVFMDTYQLLDFTHMKADTLTVRAPDGTDKKYKDMTACDLTEDADADCTSTYGVASMKVSADDGWAARYAFPQTSNVGDWKASEFPATTVSETRKVVIMAIKPDVATILEWNMATGADDAAKKTDAEAKKIVLIRYRFDIAGITASGEGSGKWTNYDPTILSSTPGDEPPAPDSTPDAAQVSRTATRTLASFGLLAMFAIAFM